MTAQQLHLDKRKFGVGFLFFQEKCHPSLTIVHFTFAVFIKKDLTSLTLIVIIIKSLGEVAELVEGAALEML